MPVTLFKSRHAKTLNPKPPNPEPLNPQNPKPHTLVPPGHEAHARPVP